MFMQKTEDSARNEIMNRLNQNQISSKSSIDQKRFENNEGFS